MKWENPPPPPVSTPRRSWHVEMFDALRQHPGKWARIMDTATSTTAVAIRNSLRIRYSPDEYEIVSNGRAAVWARYIGKDTNEG